ncbi:hypothetical protein K490DRAFT_62927 [Saccharata proteae CBS 121410]|uniref:GOLD domain-containing protein n=1 Tax=Saccharata proteae CBS 121410 TaxID=1314787 RepID=A0A9P4M1M0_9PEZI|nr:hypothetical protein K490DRAFT_62927 [Saccharata proteae CBS 121410]
MFASKALIFVIFGVASVLAEGGPYANFTISGFERGCSPAGCCYDYNITGTDMPFTTSCNACISTNPDDTFFCDNQSVSFKIPDGKTLDVWNEYVGLDSQAHVSNGSYVFSCNSQTPAISFRIYAQGATCIGCRKQHPLLEDSAFNNNATDHSKAAIMLLTHHETTVMPFFWGQLFHALRHPSRLPIFYREVSEAAYEYYHLGDDVAHLERDEIIKELTDARRATLKAVGSGLLLWIAMIIFIWLSFGRRKL